MRGALVVQRQHLARGCILLAFIEGCWWAQRREFDLEICEAM